MRSNVNGEAYLRRDDLVHHLTGGVSRFISRDEFPEWFSSLKNRPLNQPVKKPRLIHLLYESGAFFLGNEVREMPFYAVDTEFSSINFAKYSDQYLNLVSRSGPSFEEYQAAFLKIQNHLHAGNAYQVNLTFPFNFSVDEKFSESNTFSFLHSPKAGSFAQSIFWPELNFSFISNSPETLFTSRLNRAGNWRIASMPIKGTAKSDEWEKLSSSMKDQAELLMITDLVRNDLNRLSGGQAQVDALKARLDVPGLVHQYSEVSAEVAGTTSVGAILECLFPGGSITGAPKKRVGQIIDEVELEPRGFYCGSTLFWDGGGLSASINIRSGTIDWNTHQAKLHAGGGITVLSDAQSEWQELLGKLESFKSALTQARP